MCNDATVYDANVQVAGPSGAGSRLLQALSKSAVVETRDLELKHQKKKRCFRLVGASLFEGGTQAARKF